MAKAKIAFSAPLQFLPGFLKLIYCHKYQTVSTKLKTSLILPSFIPHWRVAGCINFANGWHYPKNAFLAKG
jgi:hypothetical protein